MRILLVLASVATTLLVSVTGFGQSSAPAQANEFLCAVWPNRVLYFDQMTDEFTEAFHTRHGAITGSGVTSDKSRLFVITNRMESVEIIDPIERDLVDAIKLSSASRQIRISRVSPNQDGTKLYLAVTVVNRALDRFELEEGVELITYDVANKKVIDEFSLPRTVMPSGRSRIHVAPDGESFYVIARDVHQVDAETHEVIDRLELSKPFQPGYGAVRGMSLIETEPGTFYGIYRTTDPVQKRKLFGVTKLELYDKRVSTFELGLELRLRRFALSPDGKKAYAGLQDMIAIDMEKRKVLLKKEGFERGRENLSIIVSHDGTKLYVSGVGDTMYVYDAQTLEPIKTVFAGGDFMLPPIEIPRSAAAPSR